jgi:hypothetical protein
MPSLAIFLYFVNPRLNQPIVDTEISLHGRSPQFSHLLSAFAAARQPNLYLTRDDDYNARFSGLRASQLEAP